MLSKVCYDVGIDQLCSGLLERQWFLQPQIGRMKLMLISKLVDFGGDIKMSF